KCLHKEPQKRYTSAEALAEDLRRWQADEPITARPVSRSERLVKWVRRRPAWASLLVLVTILLLSGPLVAIQQAELRRQADDAREDAVSQKRIAQQNEADATRAGNELQQANTELRQSRNALQKSNDQLLTSMARSLVRPFGAQDHADHWPLGVAEI